MFYYDIILYITVTGNFIPKFRIDSFDSLHYNISFIRKFSFYQICVSQYHTLLHIMWTSSIRAFLVLNRPLYLLFHLHSLNLITATLYHYWLPVERFIISNHLIFTNELLTPGSNNSNINNNNEAFILRHKMREQTERHTSLQQSWTQSRIDTSSTDL